MNIHNYSIPLALAFICASLTAGDAAQDDGLVEGHLRQVCDIDRSEARPGTDLAIKAFKHDIEANAKRWTDQLTQEATQPASHGLVPEIHSAFDGQDAKACEAVLRKGVALPDLLAMAMQRNPAIQAARENLRASLKQFTQAAFLEETVAQYRSFVREIDTKVGPQKHKEMPGKTFPYPSTLALKGQLVDLQAKVAWLNYQKEVRQALNNTARMFFNAQYLDQAIVIVEANRKLFAKMEAIALEQLKVGRVSQADSLKAQSMLAMLDNRIKTLQAKRANLAIRINALLNLSPEAAWGPLRPIDLKDNEQAYATVLEAARKSNQELATAKRMEDMANTMVRLAETMVLPRGSKGMSQLAPSMGAEAGPTRSPAAAFPKREMLNTKDAGFGANAAYIDELRVRVKQAQEMTRMQSVKLEATLHDAFTRVDTGRRDRKTYGETVVPKALQAYETMRSRYNTAKAPFIEYLDAGRSYLDASLKLEEARRDHNVALVDQQDALGQTSTPLLNKTHHPEKGMRHD